MNAIFLKYKLARIAKEKDQVIAAELEKRNWKIKTE